MDAAKKLLCFSDRWVDSRMELSMKNKVSFEVGKYDLTALSPWHVGTWTYLPFSPPSTCSPGEWLPEYLPSCAARGREQTVWRGRNPERWTWRHALLTSPHGHVARHQTRTLLKARDVRHVDRPSSFSFFSLIISMDENSRDSGGTKLVTLPLTDMMGAMF